MNENENNVEKVLEYIKKNYLCDIFGVEKEDIYIYNTIKQHISNQQSKLDKIKESVDKALCYINPENWYEGLKDIQQILKEKL